MEHKELKSIIAQTKAKFGILDYEIPPELSGQDITDKGLIQNTAVHQAQSAKLKKLLWKFVLA